MVSIRYPVAILLFSYCTVARASEFVGLCRSSMERTPALLAECREHSRAFTRSFSPSGRGAPVAEEHHVWFETTRASSHFGFGCVLGPKGEVRFFGLYYFLNKDQFQQANVAPLAFVDFSGNVGLRDADGSRFTLLAVHRVTEPAREPSWRDGNCEIGYLESNLTIQKKSKSNSYESFRVEPGPPMILTYCLDQEIRPKSSQCSKQEVVSFVNQTTSRIVYHLGAIAISEEGRMFAANKLVQNVCRKGASPLLEYVSIVREACELQR
jgi:hypothetical protein